MLKGALKSKTVWWNVLLAVLGGLELMGGHMTVLWGQEVAAAILDDIGNENSDNERCF